MSRHAALVSTGLFVPERELPNEELRRRWGARHPDLVDKLEAVSGIKTRWLAPEDWATSDLIVPAAHMAIDRAGIRAEDLDLILVGTDTPDYITPATSVIVQDKLGARRAGTFDIGCACASVPSAIATAAGLISTNQSIRYVLVAGAYLMHKLADPDDPMSFFYGDGAGAIVLRASPMQGVIGVAFRADGSYADRWGITSGGTAEPATVESVESGRTKVRMLDKYPPEINEDGWPELVERLCGDNDFELGDIDLLIFTQVRKTTIETVMGKLELPMEKTHMVMHKWGYTGSACVAMALHDAVETKRVATGDLVVMVGSGVGYNQAAVAVRVTDALRLGRPI